jgi:prepilin peptidase CpaA
MSATIGPTILWITSLCALIWGSRSDWHSRIIPDSVSACVAVSGLAIAFMLRPADIYASLGTFAIVFIGMCTLAHFDFIGGGDVKLISTVTLLVPSNEVPSLLLEIALVGGVLSCAYLLVRTLLRRELLRSTDGYAAAGLVRCGVARRFRQETARIIAGEPMPYAIAILGGVLCHGIRELCQCYPAVCSLL